eukprot:TRINITY_DN11113_c0_g1_i4.p1 TRINITY_DN11113_c0_g1~~TRINITY_DN11113_c0_g1_i4.p1  ORF type:complete len:465 (+),score=73.40 TRINITY_DN11113_c0_g1_i4:68-1462(+)
MASGGWPAWPSSEADGTGNAMLGAWEGSSSGWPAVASNSAGLTAALSGSQVWATAGTTGQFAEWSETGANGSYFATKAAQADVAAIPSADESPSLSAKGHGSHRAEVYGNLLQASSGNEVNPDGQGLTEERLAATDMDNRQKAQTFVTDKAEKATRAAQDVETLSVALRALETEVLQQAVAAEECMASLEIKAQALLKNLPQAEPVRVAPLAVRRARLEEEVRSMERRLQNFAVKGQHDTANGDCTSAEAQRRAALDSRIRTADQNRAFAQDGMHEATLLLEARLADVRERRQALEASGMSGKSSSYWRGRFEALVAAQNASADRATATVPDTGAQRLDQCLAAAAQAVEQALATPGDERSSPPAALVNALRCVGGLAQAEKRRRGLLVEQWRCLQGGGEQAMSQGLEPLCRANSRQHQASFGGPKRGNCSRQLRPGRSRSAQPRRQALASALSLSALCFRAAV